MVSIHTWAISLQLEMFSELGEQGENNISQLASMLISSSLLLGKKQQQSRERGENNPQPKNQSDPLGVFQVDSF